MVLKGVALKNYRCFESAEMRFHNRLTLIVGSSGSGKTALLEGIAVSLGIMVADLSGLSCKGITRKDAHLKAFHTGESVGAQPQYPVAVTARASIDGEMVAWESSLNQEGNSAIQEAAQMADVAKGYRERLRAGDRSLILPILAYYGAGRLWDCERTPNAFDGDVRTNGYALGLDGASRELRVADKAMKTCLSGIAGIQDVHLASGIAGVQDVHLASGIAGVQDVHLTRNLDTNEIECNYRDSDGAVMAIALSQMGDGYRSAIALIADIACRMAVLNPQLGDKALEETDGVVLIDEVELHLHPAWQYRILSDLMSIFPKVQFIVTTNAPAVISSVRSENLILLKDRMQVPAAMEVHGKDANTILRSVMGAQERPNAVLEKFEGFYAAIDEEKPDVARDILNEIANEIGGGDPELAACEVKLRLKVIRKKS